MTLRKGWRLRVAPRYHDRPLKTPMSVTCRILIIVQNLPLPIDRRVWLECQALTSAGYRVAVV